MMTDLQTKVIETDRVLMRHLTLADLNDLYALYCEGQMPPYRLEAPKSYEETKEELERIINEYYGRYGFGLWATILKKTGSFIGCCGLIPRRIEEEEAVEVSCVLSKLFWGKGLGTEAAQAIVKYGFAHLHFSRLICMTVSENEASIRVIRKIGMILEKEVEVDGKRVLLFTATRSSHPRQ